MVRPIPRRVLPHEAALIRQTADPWGGIVSETETALGYVRFEPLTEKDVNLLQGLERVSGKLFWDCTNSTPAGTVFSPGDKVRFNGVEYNIEKTASYYDDRRLHHLEIYLR